MAGAPAHRLPYLLHGSSPHARGTLAVVPLDPVVVRFIPACAGNALSADAQGRPGTVHPRIRGERRAERGRTGSLGGSSPHARGTLSEQTAYGLNPRFIPACAGNAHRWATLLREAAVHPRMRGERFEHPLLGGFNLGSSPHARGTPERRWPTCRLHRFIPACAGNAGEPGIWTRSMTVHPRMRGERSTVRRADLAIAGSSPHARGTHFQ